MDYFYINRKKAKLFQQSTLLNYPTSSVQKLKKINFLTS